MLDNQHFIAVFPCPLKRSERHLSQDRVGDGGPQTPQVGGRREFPAQSPVYERPLVKMGMLPPVKIIINWMNVK